MVNEREPPQNALSPNPNLQRQPGPEFGKTTPLSPLHQQTRPHGRAPESTLFNVPRPGHSRPEHHRPAIHNPLSVARDWAKGQAQRVLEPHTQAAQQQRNFDPYRPQGFRPIPTTTTDDVVEIPRPAGFPSFTTKAAPPQMFSSRPTATTNNFVDLTKSTNATPSNNNFLDDGSSASDPFTYLDAGKANENLKALLEGAFEDEEDKPRTRLRKKKLDKATDDLAEKLKGLEVEVKEPVTEQEDDAEEDDGTVEGLKVKLLPHQIEGVSWMHDKETGTKKTRGVLPKGGILADDMGLGKTIQSIALILMNPLPKDYDSQNKAVIKADDKPKHKLSPGLDKATLVVAPLALIKQWEAEIRDRVEDSHTLRVKVHHGPQRAKRSADLKKYDVVITTYQILVSEHGNSDATIKTGVFGVKWYRIILDEAHTIKNRNAKATQAAYALDAEYRWCLTGTPMQNNLDELQSLIRFLRIKPYDDLSTWREQITRPMNNGRGGLAIRRLQVYLKAFMKRRTKDILKQEGALRNGPSGKTENGKSKGFQIVNRTVEKVEAQFTDEERHFYERLEQRTDKSLERMMQGDSLSYASALVLLLRLRQACNHPQLVKSDLSKEKETFSGAPSSSQTPSRKKAIKPDDIDGIADMLGGLSVETKRCDVCQMELSAKESSSGAIRCGECEIDLAYEESAAQTFRKKRKEAKKKHKSKRDHKQKAIRQKNRRVITDSDDENDAQGKADGEYTGSDDSEDDDIKPVGRTKKEIISIDSSSDSETDEDEEDESDVDSELYEEEQREAQKLIISTKIRHLLRILRHDSGEHKYIVFSFFTSMLDLIEPFLKRDGLAFTRYDGAMKNDLREASLERLRNHAGTRILLCSLRAGSLGLNLTAASRVVILEPFWNPFVEEQAIDRVHRLNQIHDVIVYKMTIKDTVEARILDLQNRKRELAGATIEGNKDKNAAAKLTLKDMLALFRHDAESKATVDGIGMRERGQGLVARGGDAGGDSSGRNYGNGVVISEEKRERGVRKVTPPTTKRVEDSVYGRRW